MRSAFYYSLFTEYLGTAEILPMEAEFGLLEESCIQLDAYHAFTCISFNFRDTRGVNGGRFVLGY